MNPFARRPPDDAGVPTPLLPPALGDECTACDGSGVVASPDREPGSMCCSSCLGTGRVCTTAGLNAPADLPPTQLRGADDPPPPYHGGVPDEVRAARSSGLSSAKYAAIQAIETGRHPERVAPLDPKSTDTHPILLPNAKSPAELTSALALLALRRLEKGLHDFDPKVSFEAARVACVVASKVSELPTAPGSDVADPVARRAALVAALGTPAVIEIVIAVAGTDGPLRTALEAAGWRGPDAVPR